MTIFLNRLPACSLVLTFFLLAGCSKKTVSPESEATVPPSTAEASQAAPGSPKLKEARELLSKGDVDKAAAQLLQLQSASADFSQKDAAEFRDIMADAYSQALDASQRGDARGAAALQMIRAAGPR